MIRRACGDSYVKHDVYIDEQKGGAQKGAQGMRRGARGIKGAGDAAGCLGDAAGCEGDAGVLWHNIMCWAVCGAKLLIFALKYVYCRLFIADLLASRGRACTQSRQE